jgi:hypothetical protein
MQGWMVLDLGDTTKNPKGERDIYIYMYILDRNNGGRSGEL